MTHRTEVPNDEQLAELSVDVERHDEPWVITVRAVAKDGNILQLTWDQLASSIEVQLLQGEVAVMRVERELVESIRLYEKDMATYLEVVTSTPELSLTLNATIGDSVTVRDYLLEK